MNIDKNYYQILGVDKNTNIDEIKKNYRKISIENHPDKNKGDKTKEDKFKEASEAYSTLGDETKKQQYDVSSRFGKSYNPNPFSAFSGGSTGGFDDIFKAFFGHGGTGGMNSNPFGQVFENIHREYHENLDIVINVIVTMSDVYRGTPIRVQYKRYLHCETCKGTGFDPRSESYSCDICGGSGKDRFGRKCEYCQGAGKVFSLPCGTCNDGEKVVLKDTEFNLNNIHRIRQTSEEFLRGYGHQSKYYREKRGNLKLNVIFQDVKNYKIENNLLVYDLDLHYEDAINGLKYELEQLDGKKLIVNIPEKTNNGDIVRLKNKGILINDKDRNDLLIRINIIIDYERLQMK